MYECPEANRIKVEELYNGSDTGINQLMGEVKHILIEVSPSCDYAQKRRRLCRVVAGVLWPEEYCNRIKKHTEYIFKSPIIKYENKLYRIVLDLRLFTSLPETTLESLEVLFRIRRQLHVEIQSHLARHVNRLGLMYLH